MPVTDKSKIVNTLAWIFVLVCLIPLWRMVHHVLSETTNCLGTDYDFVVPAVVSYLDSGNTLLERIKACCFGPHCFLQQISIHAVIAHFSDWNSQVELAAGLILAIGRIPLMILTLSAGRLWTRLTLSGFVIALTFGTSSTSSFICGQPSISTGVVLLWFCLSSYCALKYSRRIIHSSLYLLSGIMAGLTGIYLLLPVALVGLIAAAVKKSKSLLWLTLASSACGGTLYVLVKSISLEQNTASDFAIRPLQFIQIIGRPFYGQLGVDPSANLYCGWVGLSGLIAFVLLLFLRLRERQTLPVSAYCYAFFGLFMALAISCTRPFIAPWYGPFALLFWIGLSSMALTLLEGKSKLSTRIASAAVLLAIIVCYATSNISFSDKDFYRLTHGPVSESILRNYQISPTYGEAYICASHLGADSYRKKIARPLAQNNWSTFAPHQYWALQGDFILPTVTITPATSYRWVDDSANLKARDWRGARKLNLLLPNNTVLDWQIKLPSSTVKANLDTALVNVQSVSAMAKLKITILRDQKVLTITNYTLSNGKSHPLSLDLSAYRGQAITLRIDNNGSSQLLLTRPHIDLFKTRDRAPQSSIIAPCNTELSPYFGAKSSRDQLLSFGSNVWRHQQVILEPLAAGGTAIKFDRSGARFDYDGDLHIPVSALKEVVFGIAADTTNEYQICALQFTTDRGQVITEQITLLNDSNWHQYSLLIRATKLEPDEFITGISFFPYFQQEHADFKLSGLTLRYH